MYIFYELVCNYPIIYVVNQCNMAIKKYMELVTSFDLLIGNSAFDALIGNSLTVTDMTYVCFGMTCPNQRPIYT